MSEVGEYKIVETVTYSVIEKKARVSDKSGKIKLDRVSQGLAPLLLLLLSPDLGLYLNFVMRVKIE